MENGRLRTFAAKRLTAWSRQTLPGWWTMLTVIIGVGFFLYLAHSMVAEDPASSPTVRGGSSTPPVSAPAPDAPPPTSQSASPVRTPASDGATTRVRTSSGKKVPAPRGAVRVATWAFEALYDPKAAARVPTSDGTPHRVPAQATAGTVSELTWLNPGEDGRMQFSARIDPDGSDGRLQPSVAYVVVADLGDGWVFLNTPS